MILDRSTSVWESYDDGGRHDWRTVLEFFQMLVADVSQDGINFALATFSEDYEIHAGFNYSYDKRQLIQLATFNNTDDNSETWIPHDVVGGKELRFLQTNYGLVIDVLQQVYENKSFGAREEARPLVFLVTDGSMDDQLSGIYDLNDCPTNDDSFVCGYDKRNDKDYNEEACKGCWRRGLASRLDKVKVKNSVSVVGIGNADSAKNWPDNRTMKVFAQNDADVLRASFVVANDWLGGLCRVGVRVCPDSAFCVVGVDDF